MKLCCQGIWIKSLWRPARWSREMRFFDCKRRHFEAQIGSGPLLGEWRGGSVPRGTLPNGCVFAPPINTSTGSRCKLAERGSRPSHRTRTSRPGKWRDGVGQTPLRLVLRDELAVLVVESEVQPELVNPFQSPWDVASSLRLIETAPWLWAVTLSACPALRSTVRPRFVRRARNAVEARGARALKTQISNFQSARTALPSPGASVAGVSASKMPVKRPCEPSASAK